LEFENSLLAIFPSAVFDSNESGACTWIRLLVNERAFAIQVTLKEGIGVSEVDLSRDPDFFGHDAVFEDLGQALEFIKEKLIG
jgi:hypothetical protein